MASDDEYEYEYSTTETETFFVDLDLSSLNGIMKSSSAGKHRSLKASEKPRKDTTRMKTTQAKPQTLASAQAEHAGEDENNDNEVIEDADAEAEADVEAEGEGEEQEDVPTPAPAQSPQQGHEGNPAQQPLKLLDDNNGPDELSSGNDTIQILDLESLNPIISYRNNIYSCTWTNMIGTSMFFTKHQDTPLHEPEIATEDYDLVGTSRIKLVGRQANMDVKNNVTADTSRKRKYATITENDGNSERELIDEEQEEGDGITSRNTNNIPNTNPDVSMNINTNMDHDMDIVERYIPPGRSLGGIKRTNPTTNIAIKQQARFLEKLMEVKKSRGETDMVRTFVDRHTVAMDEKKKRLTKKSNNNSTTSSNEIRELNRRVIRGDNDALERLQEIYSDMEGSDPDVDPDPDADPDPT